MSEHRNWIAVACREHVRRGQELGIMQVCHGKGAPLRRIRAGGRVAYYSPTVTFPKGEKCQAFTAFGVVRDGPVYQADMGNGFQPFRRDVDWRPVRETSIHPLLDRLDLTRGQRSWGYAFRYGLVAVSDHDMDLIADALLEKALA
jgi:EVE domain